LEIQGTCCVVRFHGDVKNGLPPVGVARPTHCPKCGRPAFTDGKVMLHGHGSVSRQQRGPPSPDTAPQGAVVLIRRYECQHVDCGAVIRVLPAAARAFKHFSGAAIGMALCLWGLVGLSAADVRERINDWRPGPGARGWRSLARWAGDVAKGRLFQELGLSWVPVESCALAGAVTHALAGHAPPTMRSEPIEHQAFMGACHVR
jgi:hypothetical protein